jgi:hypothetical protein
LLDIGSPGRTLEVGPEVGGVRIGAAIVLSAGIGKADQEDAAASLIFVPISRNDDLNLLDKFGG